MHAARMGIRFDSRQMALAALLLALSIVAWLVTDERMAGMDEGPGSHLGSLGFYVTAWVVMMAAMMFPSIAPMVAIYARVQAGRRPTARHVPGGTAVFVGGYLLAWTAFGLAAYGMFALVRSFDVGALAWDQGGRYLAGGVVIAAAAYQLSSLKDRCLSRCRSPLEFVMTRWRQGLGGALRMGVEHGAWCVGCCWALMAALFAVGVMSVGWMLFVAALIAVEKMAPWKALANRMIAVVLLVLGLGIVIAPGDVPGLTLPDDVGRDGGSMMMMEK
jgi:predicted metal-binding membrane protein